MASRKRSSKERPSPQKKSNADDAAHATFYRHAASKDSPTKPMGILSQTLTPSPSLRWILPAKIRSQSHHDVVFIGENFIQLRELHEDGQLADVTARIDLGEQILAAKVISAETEAKHFLDQVLDQMTAESRYVLNGESLDDSLPPQILVASVASGHLLFLYAIESVPGDIRFIYGKRSMLGGVSIPERYGKHIAVDPGSRAMAVASSMNHLMIVSLKQIDQIKDEIDLWHANSSEMFSPGREERYLQIDGLILRMDFLRSLDSDPNKIVLLLLVVQHGATSIVLYCWDASRPLSTARPLKCSGQRLPAEDTFPLMLIPLTRQTSFVIVTEDEFTIYDNILSPQTRRISMRLPKETPSDHHASDHHKSSAPPLWVQWARAPRTPGHMNSQLENIYLVREDGELRYYTINYKSKQKVDYHFRPGSLGIHVDTAFAILEPHVMTLGGDLLIAGGDMSDGGVWHLPAREPISRTQILGNWAPSLDMIVVNSREYGDLRPLRQLPRSERIFTGSGRTLSQCYVNEVRFGLEAQIGWKIEYPDATSTTRLWPLAHPTLKMLLILFSHPMHTSAIAIDTADMAVEAIEAESCPGLELETPTLGAASIENGLVIQITPERVNLIFLSANERAASFEHGEHACIAADIDWLTGRFVTAHRTSSGFELRLGTPITALGRSASIEWANKSEFLQDEPTALCLTKLGNIDILLAGTAKGTLFVFLTDHTRGLKLAFQNSVADLVGESQHAAISSLLMLSHGNTTNGALLLGCRDGSLLVAYAGFERGPPMTLSIDVAERLSMGSVTVVLSEDLVDPREKSALAICGSELRRIRLHNDSGRLDVQISSIWLTNRENESYLQPPVNSACRIPSFSTASDAGLAGLLLCAVEAEFLISSLVSQEQAVPRRMPLDGGPQRLAYSRHLNKIVAAVNHISILDEIKDAAPIRSRLIKPALQLVSPGSIVSSHIPHSAENVMIIGEPGEKVRCVLNWTPSDGTKHYDMILVGLETDTHDKKPRSGRVALISSKNIGKGSDSGSKAKTVSKYSGKPIYSLCAYGRNSLLTAAGDEIIMQSLDIGSRKWSTSAHFKLPSPALSLTTQGSLIFAATMHHSLVTIVENNGSLSLHASDLKARNATQVIAVPGLGPLVTTTSNTGTGLLGFSEQPSQKRSSVQFEAVMPLTMERIRLSLTSSNQNSRHHIYGNSIDGTIYRFITLQNHEWQLLRFLEGLKPISHVISLEPQSPRHHSDSESSRTSSEWSIISGSGSPPGSSPRASSQETSKMHVHGDVLALLLQPGRLSMRDLLETGVKVEDGAAGNDEAAWRISTFEELAVPVVGVADDLILAVSRWLRRLMRMPQ